MKNRTRLNIKLPHTVLLIIKSSYVRRIYNVCETRSFCNDVSMHYMYDSATFYKTLIN
ncbi:hypothetical protein Hanom_Chr16g01455281 [Helianthus anomalus]